MRYIQVLLLFLVALSVSAQKDRINQEGLEALLSRLEAEKKERSARVKKFLDRNGKNAQFQFNPSEKYIYDIQDGIPIIIGIDNSEAAEAIGVTKLRDAGDLSLNLTGKDEEAGIWDGGIIRTTHEALRGRIRYQDGSAGSEFSDHATSVAGTLMGSGIQSRAQGMAYEANIVAYDFNNDEQEMVAAQLQRQLILSNHSYGQRRGWDDNRWHGDATISTQEDWRFGFYDSQAKTWDDIAVNAPYYLIVKSAGNDRGDSGTSANFPPDGPFDCIAGSSLAKNIVTIGAVRKNRQGYTPASNIEMSSFSSWGPTDDGRIKPDFVAVGVDIFSPSSFNDNSYNSTQGTSFSSPSAAGGLLLLQQLHRQLTNRYMRSATLKALAIHTTKEAGASEGPDYRFGWGLLDVEAAAKVILKKDQTNTFVLEGEVENDKEYTLELNPLMNSPLIATLVWTDPSGSPTSPSLDPKDLMLVNDLDMRVEDETGNSFFPYILDPENPGRAATRGDNFRDNVEKIVINSLEPRKYFLKIRHKSTLTTPRQTFSLILEYNSETNPSENLYWVGNENVWSGDDVWSLSSGGNPSTNIPNENFKIIIDDNSISGDDQVITLDKSYTIDGLSVFTQKPLVLDLNGHTLTSTGPLIFGNAGFQVVNGVIALEAPAGSGDITLNFGEVETDDIKIVLNEKNEATWTCIDCSFNAQSIRILSGRLDIVQSLISVSDVFVRENAQLTLDDVDLLDLNNLLVEEGASYRDSENSSLSFLFRNGLAEWTNQNVLANIVVSGMGFINSFGSPLGHVNIQSGNLKFNTVASVQGLELGTGANLGITDTLVVRGDEFNLAPGGRLESEFKAVLHLNKRQLFCFEELNISNIDVSGAAVISVGVQSTLSNAIAWIQRKCTEVLFADFETDVLCASGLTKLTSASSGPIKFYEWYVNGQLSSSGNEHITYYSFPTAANYQVELVVKDELGASNQWAKELTVVNSGLDSNYILRNTTQLVSFRSGQQYQWFRNNEPIQGAIERTLPYNGEMAVFFVVVTRDGCNRKSTELDLTNNVINIDSADPENGIDIGPNPVQHTLLIYVPPTAPGALHIEMSDAIGRRMAIKSNLSKGTIEWDMSAYPSGIYYIKLRVGDKEFSKTVVKTD